MQLQPCAQLQLDGGHRHHGIGWNICTQTVGRFGFGNAGMVFYDKDDNVVTRTPDTWAVPIGAVRVEGIAVSVNWDAQGWGLAPVSTTLAAACSPNPGTPTP